MVTTGQRGEQRRRRRKIDYPFVSHFTLQTDSSRCRENFWDANQIVCSCRQHKEPFHQAAIMSSAVVRSAVPLASVSRASMISPLRFSIIRCPM